MLAVRDLPGDSYSDIEIYSESSSPHQRHRLLTLLATFLVRWCSLLTNCFNLWSN